MSAIPSSVTWTQVSGLQPLIEPCLKQTLKFLPRPDVWNALGPVPSACLLFLGAYYQAWSQQVSVACLSFSASYPLPPVLTPLPHSSSVGTSPRPCGLGSVCIDVVLGVEEWNPEPHTCSCFSTEPTSPFHFYLCLPAAVSPGLC